MERTLFISLCLVFFLSSGAFLLYVPALSVAATALVACGLIVAFSLGLYLGDRQSRVRNGPERNKPWIPGGVP